MSAVREEAIRPRGSRETGAASPSPTPSLLSCLFRPPLLSGVDWTSNVSRPPSENGSWALHNLPVRIHGIHLHSEAKHIVAGYSGKLFCLTLGARKAITVPPRTHNHSSCLPLPPPSLPRPTLLYPVSHVVKPNEPFRGRAERKEVVARIIAPDVQTSERASERTSKRTSSLPLPSPTDTVMSPLRVRNFVVGREIDQKTAKERLFQQKCRGN